VSVGRCPDKRPDNRLGKVSFLNSRVTGSRKRNRLTPT
jgi:hypothetical protein